MKFLFHSRHGDAAGVAWRVMKEGNDVWLYIPRDKGGRNADHYKATLRGLVPQVQSVSEGLAKKPDVVIFDMVGDGELAYRIRRAGYNVLGSGAMFKGKSFQDQIELDRSFGEKIMAISGIKTPETVSYKAAQISEAISFVKKNKEKRYVTKPDGNKNPHTTYVAESNEDTIDHLKHLQEKKLLAAGESFVLQEFLEGVEISTEMWFSKGRPIFPGNGTIETKKFLVGDLGPNTGCSTSCCWFYERKEPQIIQRTLKKLYKMMELVEYTGPIDINTIVSAKDHMPYGIEWTARPGYSAIYGLIRLLDLEKLDLGEHLHQLATGQIEEFVHKKGFGYALRVSIPPYPLSIQDDKIRQVLMEATACQDITFRGIPEDAYFPLDVQKSENHEGLETAGVDGVVCEVTGYGKSVEEAKTEAHEHLKKVKVPQKQARLDGWKRPIKDLKTLKSWGYEMPNPDGEKNVQLSNVA